jgi:hypothetical protein
LFTGPHAQAETLFLQSLMKLQGPYFIDAALLQNLVSLIIFLGRIQNILHIYNQILDASNIPYPL